MSHLHRWENALISAGHSETCSVLDDVASRPVKSLLVEGWSWTDPDVLRVSASWYARAFKPILP